MSKNNDIADLLPENKNKKKDKWSSLLNDIRSIEETSETNTSSTFLPSSLLKEQNKPKEDNDKNDNDDDVTGDDWLTTIELLCSKPSKKKIRKASDDLFESAGLKKKKKKHKDGKDDNLVDYRREFEPEMALYKNLLISQNKFTDSLQKNYDQIMAMKSSNRGVTKQLTDLIENINDARTLSMQLVEKNINAKKTIAELNMKQKKEFGSGTLDGSSSLSDYASVYLKQMMNERQSLMTGVGSADISDYSEDELLDAINLNLGDSHDDNMDNALKYESVNAQVYVLITNDDIQNYEFIAKDDNDNVLLDYPLPMKSPISVNRSTDIATDTYGRHYPIIWEDNNGDILDNVI